MHASSVGLTYGRGGCVINDCGLKLELAMNGDV